VWWNCILACGSRPAQFCLTCFLPDQGQAVMGQTSVIALDYLSTEASSLILFLSQKQYFFLCQIAISFSKW
jgi:hypothetical protein